ncbi:MAG TPA: hypothetical protein VD766_10810 [Solirubrobacterales bacterium]|nr:hypothetical protein [Solirubrobacterales bacterium]
MLGRNHSTTHDKGAGLARGPAYIIGSVLAAFGLILLLQSGDNPINFATDGFPDADVSGEKFIGFEWNGWTAWITIAAGALLLFGAAQHAVAKAFSLVVGLGLGACALIGFVDGDVLGLAAANWLTELGWGIAAVLLVLNVMAPRVGGDDPDHDRPVVDRDRDGVDDRDEHRAPVVDRDRDGVDDRDEARTRVR